MDKNVSELWLTTKYKGKKAFGDMRSDISNTSSDVKQLAGGLAALAGVGGIGLLVNSQLEAIDSLAKWSDKLGTTTESLSRLQFATSQTSDITEDQLNVSLQRMTRRIAEAAKGMGEARGALQDLGLDAQELSRIGPEQAFFKIADAMSEVDNQAERVRLSFKLFDSEGVGLVNTLDEGSAALKELGKQADLAGLSVSRVDASKVEMANDAFARSQKIAVGVGRTIAVEVSPVIEALATSFFNAATEAGGMAEVVNNGMKVAVDAVGILANGVSGVSLVWKTLKAVTQDTVAFMMEGVVAWDQTISRIVSKIPGVTWEASESLQGMWQVYENAAKESWDAVRNHASEPLPSQSINEWYSNVQRKSEETAQKIAESKNEMMNLGGSDSPDGDLELNSTQQRLNELMEMKKLHDLDWVQTEEVAYLKRVEMLRLNYENGVIPTQEQYDKLRVEHAEKFQDKITEIHNRGLTEREIFEKMSLGNKTKAVLSHLTEMTQGVAQHNRALFEINKVASIANTVISTYEGAQKAYTAYASYPPLAAAMAAVAVAAGVARINAIRKQSFSKGGGVSSGSVSVGGAAVTTAPSNIGSASQSQTTQTENAPVTINLNVHGLVSDDAVDLMVEKLGDAINNRGEIVIESTSQQALEIQQAS